MNKKNLHPEIRINESRRGFVKKSILGSTAIALSGGVLLASPTKKEITHIVSLSFDDGFEKSFVKTAEIYERYKLSACFNILATGHEKNFTPVGEYIKSSILGDFDLWNDLKKRGHEIMPHGYRHANLRELPLAEGKDLINKTFDVFEEKLDGFDAFKSIFSFPFNASNQAIEDWLAQKVLAYRTSGRVWNTLPYGGQKKLTCISKGPENLDVFMQDEINKFLAGPSGWFIFNTHGLDGEGWGPMSSSLLDELLDKLTSMENVAVLPVGKALLSAKK
jgi:peptidoglycan/xylan/chitin deacetylase (PgdA/CDA1 family)